MKEEKAASYKFHSPVEEISLAPALWLWDYLRRSGARGFFIPLSGGADSASVAAIVASMAREVLKQAKKDKECLADLRKVVKDPNFTPDRFEDIVRRILVTSYLGTANSSEDTKSRS